VLAIDQRGHPVGGFAGSQQQGITALAHRRIRTEHGAELQRIAAFQRALGHDHQHARDKRALIAARPVLAVIDAVEQAMEHHGPFAMAAVYAGVFGRVGLPGRARGVAGHGIVAQGAHHGIGGRGFRFLGARGRQAHCAVRGGGQQQHTQHSRHSWLRSVTPSRHIHCALRTCSAGAFLSMRGNQPPSVYIWRP